LITVLNKTLTTPEGLQTELIAIDGKPGLMQSQFATLLSIPAFRLSQILNGNDLVRYGISGSDAKELKKLGIIKLNGKGNFLPIETVRQVLWELGTATATELHEQIGRIHPLS
jgi:predicted transcriptional regulator